MQPLNTENTVIAKGQPAGRQTTAPVDWAALSEFQTCWNGVTLALLVLVVIIAVIV